MTSRHDVVVFMLRITSRIYFFKISVSVIMWEKESDTRCLLRSTVLKVVQKCSLNNTLLNSFKNCWSQETTHDRSSISSEKLPYYLNKHYGAIFIRILSSSLTNGYDLDWLKFKKKRLKVLSSKSRTICKDNKKCIIFLIRLITSVLAFQQYSQ